MARAIYDSRIPVISAVGHEVDFTISDFVADLRAPTPSAAAELVVPSQEELKDKFNNVYGRLYSCAGRILEKNRLRLRLLTEKPVLKTPERSLDERRLYLDGLYNRFENAYKNILKEKEQALKLNASKLDGLSPLSALSRGFSVTKDEGGRVVKSVEQVKKGDKISVVVSDGEIRASVE